MATSHERALRAGFTIIELLIALVLVGVGLTALAATGALVARETRAALSRGEAAVVARNRAELFLASCDSLAAGGLALGKYGIRERWSVVADSPLMHLTDSVVYAEYDRRRALTIVVSRPC